MQSTDPIPQLIVSETEMPQVDTETLVEQEGTQLFFIESNF
jgi:hypothetical protein